MKVFDAGHVWKALASSAHWKVEPVSFAENVNVALDVATTPLGPDVMEVSGGWMSTVQERTESDSSTLPWASMARTSRVCGPWARLLNVGDAEHPFHVVESSRHWNVTYGSSAESEKVAVRLIVTPVGPPEMVLEGCLWSARTSAR